MAKKKKKTVVVVAKVCQCAAGPYDAAGRCKRCGLTVAGIERRARASESSKG